MLTPIPSPFVRDVILKLTNELNSQVETIFWGDMSHRPHWGNAGWQGVQLNGSKSAQMLQLRAELQRIAPDIILVSGYSSSAARAARAFAIKHSIPFVPTLVEPSSPAEGLRRILRREYIRWYFKPASGLACMGARAAQEYASLYAGPMVDTPYAFDLEILLRHERPRRVGPEMLTFIYSGRFRSIRHPLLTVRAFSRVYRQTGGKVHLILSGKGPQAEEVRQLVEDLGIAAGVSWMNDFEGWHDIMNLYRHGDVLLSPNVYSTWNLTIQEGMASGVAVVSTWTTEAAANLIMHGYNGLIVRPDDEVALSNAMLQYYNDQNLLSLHGSRSREMVQTIDAACIAKRLAGLISQILEDR